MTAAATTKTSPHSFREIFMRRTWTCYRDMGRRFAERKDKHGRITRAARTLPFTLDQFRRWALEKYFQNDYDRAVNCTYCGMWLDAKDISWDHATPVSRGGTLGLDNLIGCCDQCNRIKGKLTQLEYMTFRKGMETFPDAARADIYHRLKTGAGFTRLRFFKHGADAKKKPEPTVDLGQFEDVL